MTVSMTTNKKVNKIAVVQTGGCSAVINSTLAGIVENAKASGLTIYGLLNGFEGLLNNKIIDLSVLGTSTGNIRLKSAQYPYFYILYYNNIFNELRITKINISDIEKLK